MNPEVERLLGSVRSNLAELCRKFGVRKLEIFGSAVTDGWDNACSDLDFVAEFDAPPAGIDLFAQFFVFQVELERLLGRKVDLIERKAIRKALFREAVDASAREVYAA